MTDIFIPAATTCAGDSEDSEWSGGRGDKEAGSSSGEDVEGLLEEANAFLGDKT